MAGLAPTLMSCTAAVRGNASSFVGSALSSSVAAAPAKPLRMVTRISAAKPPEECNDEECAPAKEVHCEFFFRLFQFFASGGFVSWPVLRFLGNLSARIELVLKFLV